MAGKPPAPICSGKSRDFGDSLSHSALGPMQNQKIGAALITEEKLDVDFNDLLDVERLVAGKIRLNRQPLDMAGAVRRAVAAFTGDARLDRQIEVSTEPAWVDVDAVRLEQVLTNLMANAVKYTPPGGRIRVTLRADGSDAVLAVEDAGFGISPILLPFIFYIHGPADRTLDRAQGGLGIGLTLVRRLVELHGGTIVAESAGEGHGSTFTVRLRQISQDRVSAGREVRLASAR